MLAANDPLASMQASHINNDKNHHNNNDDDDNNDMNNKAQGWGGLELFYDGFIATWHLRSAWVARRTLRPSGQCLVRPIKKKQDEKALEDV